MPSSARPRTGARRPCLQLAPLAAVRAQSSQQMLWCSQPGQASRLKRQAYRPRSSACVARSSFAPRKQAQRARMLLAGAPSAVPSTGRVASWQRQWGMGVSPSPPYKRWQRAAPAAPATRLTNCMCCCHLPKAGCRRLQGQSCSCTKRPRTSRCAAAMPAAQAALAAAHRQVPAPHGCALLRTGMAAAALCSLQAAQPSPAQPAAMQQRRCAVIV